MSLCQFLDFFCLRTFNLFIVVYYVYVGKNKNQHTGADAKYQSKKVPPERLNDSRGSYLIIENNEQFIPYCVIHLAEKELMDNLKTNPDLTRNWDASGGLSLTLLEWQVRKI